MNKCKCKDINKDLFEIQTDILKAPFFLFKNFSRYYRN